MIHARIYIIHFYEIYQYDMMHKHFVYLFIDLYSDLRFIIFFVTLILHWSLVNTRTLRLCIEGTST